MTFNDDGSLRCNLCNSDPCVCGKSRDPSREAFEAFVCREYSDYGEQPWLVRKYADGSYKDAIVQSQWVGWQAALAWKAEQVRTEFIARHDHERGAPLTYECSTWCRVQHDQFTRSLEQTLKENANGNG